MFFFLFFFFSFFLPCARSRCRNTLGRAADWLIIKLRYLPGGSSPGPLAQLSSFIHLAGTVCGIQSERLVDQISAALPHLCTKTSWKQAVEPTETTLFPSLLQSPRAASVWREVSTVDAGTRRTLGTCEQRDFVSHLADTFGSNGTRRARGSSPAFHTFGFVSLLPLAASGAGLQQKDTTLLATVTDVKSLHLPCFSASVAKEKKSRPPPPPYITFKCKCIRRKDVTMSCMQVQPFIKSKLFIHI